MIGYVTNETPDLMPFHRLLEVKRPALGTSLVKGAPNAWHLTPNTQVPLPLVLRERPPGVGAER